MQSELGDFLKVYIQTDSLIIELGVPTKGCRTASFRMSARLEA